MGNLVQTLAAASVPAQAGRPAQNSAGGTTAGSSSGGSSTAAPAAQGTPIVANGTNPQPTQPAQPIDPKAPKPYKPPVPKEPASVVTGRFGVFLAKCPVRSREEVVESFKTILVREPPKPTSNVLMWVTIAIVLFIIIGIGIWYYTKTSSMVENPKAKSKAHKSPTASIKKEIAKSSPLTE